jgi:hypothetical protein
LHASRPNLFRSDSRTGPRWASAHSPSSTRDRFRQFTTLHSGRRTVKNDPQQKFVALQSRRSTSELSRVGLNELLGPHRQGE